MLVILTPWTTNQQIWVDWEIGSDISFDFEFGSIQTQGRIKGLVSI